ncbi:MAG: hypothetical protein AB2557_14100 [Candidatus Thiodiazotropha sp.]
MRNTTISLSVITIIILSGCTNKPSCVAVHNPNEKIIPAKVIGKKHIAGPVLLNPPKSVRVTGHSTSGAGLPERIVMLAAFAVVGAAVVDSPEAVEFTGTQLGASAYNQSTIPANQNATVGDSCNDEGILLEHGATQYTVTSKSKTYRINSAFPGFEVGDCVNVFVSYYGSNTNARIARGFDCEGD